MGTACVYVIGERDCRSEFVLPDTVGETEEPHSPEEFEDFEVPEDGHESSGEDCSADSGEFTNDVAATDMLPAASRKFDRCGSRFIRGRNSNAE